MDYGATGIVTTPFERPWDDNNDLGA